MAKHHVTATVNGDPVEFLCETQDTLLDVLRDQVGRTGTQDRRRAPAAGPPPPAPAPGPREACAAGDCGACSVTVDARLVCSCLMLAVEAEGKAVETIEGMARGDELHPLQRSLLE